MSDVTQGWCDRRSINGIKRSHEYRSPYVRDECRVVHSFGFRRLQGKTQMLGPEQSGFHHNRLTHSIEVASICKSITLYLRKLCHQKKRYKKYQACLKLLKGTHRDYDYLITAIGLLHDIGHPPFGHRGEVALNFKMHEQGGFEGNAQTLRLLTDLEDFTEKNGLDLTRRTLLGLVKYPAAYSRLCTKYPPIPTKNEALRIKDWLPPKCYYDADQYIIDWLLEKINEKEKEKFTQVGEIKFKDSISHKRTLYQSFDCSIMDMADDIAYSVHDIEDAIHLGLIQSTDFQDKKIEDALAIFSDWPTELIEKICQGKKKKKWYEYLFDKEEWKRKAVLGHMIHTLIEHIVVGEHQFFKNPVLRYYVAFKKEGTQSKANEAVESLKDLIKAKVFDSEEIQDIVFGGVLIITQLFDAIIENPKKMLPIFYQERINQGKNSLHRSVCDYISNMTDEGARHLHADIYGNNEA